MNNPYALEEDRPVYFVSDHVHLIKTVRNSFSSSRFATAQTPLKRLMEKWIAHPVDVCSKTICVGPQTTPKMPS